jgi:peptidoglycan hydrolase CwlO-like protein
MNKNEGTRLDRIEEKIDKLCDAVVSLARAEEKIHSLEEKTVTIWQSIDDLHTKFDEMEERLRDAEVLLAKSKETISSIVNLGWIVIGAIVTAGIGTLLMVN